MLYNKDYRDVITEFVDAWDLLTSEARERYNGEDLQLAIMSEMPYVRRYHLAINSLKKIIGRTNLEELDG